jgi:ABC-type lipoprotein export system ATPase subunit
MNGQYAIETEAVRRVYHTRGADVTALQGVNLRVTAGRFVALKGRSGSGKTTLLNCLGGLDRPTSGTVRVFDQDLGAMTDRQVTLWRREKIGFIFQSFGLLPTLSAYENVELVLRLNDYSRSDRRARALYCLDVVGLSKRGNHRPYELSGGQQQRVAIARALMQDPELMLADEPVASLDPATSHGVMKYLESLNRDDGLTVLCSLHFLSLARTYSDRVIALKDGKLEFDGPPEEIDNVRFKEIYGEDAVEVGIS